MDAKNKVTDEEKKSLFPIVAYGIHSRYQKRLQEFMREEFDTKSVFIYEYFLTKPFVRGEEGRAKIPDYGPFLLRILYQAKFVPEITERKPQRWVDIRELPWTLDNVRDFWNFKARGAGASDIEYTTVIKEIFASWKEEKGSPEVPDPKKNKPWKGWLEYEKSSGIVKGNFKFPIEYLQEDYLSDMSSECDEFSYWGLLKEYMLVVLPWLRNKSEYLNVGVFSISSKNIFYGDILIIYPETEKLKGERGIFELFEGRESRVISYLKDFIKNTFVPSLLFFEELWEEKELKQELDTQPEWDKYIFLKGTLKNSDEPIEKAMYELWDKRKEIYDNYHPKEKAVEKIKESLLFPKYVIASVVMVKEIKKIATPRSPRKNRSYLPCFLVIGKPGSGKDTLAKIIQFFFPEYRFGKRYIINMAQLKPNYLSVPLMSGGELELVKVPSSQEIQDTPLKIEMKIKGLFKKIWELHKKEHPDLETARKNGMMPVVILDELNSLDIDAQGALLRVLENARLQPLGSPEEEKEEVDFLVIGTVNEPEEVLTLEDTLRSFLIEKHILGDVLGKALYEHFRNIRRLREDVFHRLIREGKVNIPDLRDRREDIPILFAFFVKDMLPDEIKWHNLWFDFGIFEELMRETYLWTGNFRELQSIAKKTANNALLDGENIEVLKKLKSGETVKEFFTVDMKHIKETLEEMRKSKRGNDFTF